MIESIFLAVNGLEIAFERDSDDLESVGQDVIVDGRDHHCGEGDEERLNGETLSQEQQHRTDHSAPDRDGPGGDHPSRKAVEELQLLGRKAAHIGFVPGLRHNVVHRTHAIP